jgi:5'-deoxynucleotidase YfbR-like HD superfamily hydrolase|tara:strand:- start:179 stop:604 length:426 start_codon:yes stop_codon:yes gene_type:complete
MIDNHDSKDERKKIISEFDEAMKICEPRFNSTTSKVSEFEKEFLLCWKKYKKTGQHQEFLKISDEFANLLQMQNEAFIENGDLLNPILAKLDSVIEQNCEPMLKMISEDILKQDGVLPKGFGTKSKFNPDRSSSGTLPKGF